MRIRKNAARLSTLSLSTSWISPSDPSSALPLLVPKTDKCELNMSPWDAMALVPQSDFYLPLQSQVEEASQVIGSIVKEEPVVLNGSIGSSKKQCKKEIKKEVKQEVEQNVSLLNGVDKKKMNQQIVKREFIYCIRSDGKGWQCKNEAKENRSLCEHHLNKLKSNSHSSQKSHVQKVSKKSNALKVPSMVVPRGRKAKKKPDSPTELSPGISPLWARKRALGNREDHKKGSDGEIIGDVGECSQASSEYIEDVLYDSTDDDDNDASDGSRKRRRKPIKARSLRSLF